MFAKTFLKPFLCAKKMLQSYKSACTKKDIPKEEAAEKAVIL